MIKDCTYQRIHCMLPAPLRDSLTNYRWCEHSYSQLMHNLYSQKEAQQSWPIRTPALPVPELLPDDSWKWDHKTVPQFHRFHRHCGKLDSCCIFLRSETKETKPKQNHYSAMSISIFENLCCGIQDMVSFRVQVTLILCSHYRQSKENNWWLS